ncbi:MAG: hypothetical protein HXY23_12715 [Parvularculaceae bacterium]|nr:hypothetical protein [Parvularculaceae bacterium]
MLLFRTVLIAILCMSSVAVKADNSPDDSPAPSYSLQLTYRVDGEVVATPSIIVRYGQEAEVESVRGYPYKLRLLLGAAPPAMSSSKASLAVEVFVKDDAGARPRWKKIASPVIVKKLDDQRFSHRADVSRHHVRSIADPQRFLESIEIEAVVTKAGSKVLGDPKKCDRVVTSAGDAPGDNPTSCCSDGCLKCCGAGTCCADSTNCPGGGCCTD